MDGTDVLGKHVGFLVWLSYTLELRVLELVMTWYDVMGRRVTWVLAELHLVKDLTYLEIFPLLFPLPVAVTVWGAAGQKGVMFHTGSHTVAHIINKQVAKLPFPLQTDGQMLHNFAFICLFIQVRDTYSRWQWAVTSWFMCSGVKNSGS